MKRTGASLKGVFVIDVLTGKGLGQLNDLLIDLKEMNLYGMVVIKGRLFEKQKFIPFQHLLGVGRDAMMMEYREDDVNEEVEYRRFSHFKGHRMITANGDYFGELADILVDLSTGKIDDYLLYPIESGERNLFMLSAQYIHLLGEDIIIVSRESPDKTRPFQEEKMQEKGTSLPLWPELKEEWGELRERLKNTNAKRLRRLTGMEKGEEIAQEILLTGEGFKGQRLAKQLLDEGGEVLAEKGAPLTQELIRKIISLNRLPELLESLRD